jgi:hypothetical protein
VFLYQNPENISSLTLLNHGKAYAIKKHSFLVWTCISVLGPLKIPQELNSSHSGNSSLGLWLGSFEKNCWLFVLDILDDCKCLQSSLALCRCLKTLWQTSLTIITPIGVNTTFSINLVHWLNTAFYGLDSWQAMNSWYELIQWWNHTMNSWSWFLIQDDFMYWIHGSRL